MSRLNTHSCKFPPSARERIELNHDKDAETGCWMWKGKPQTSGYGTCCVNYKFWLAHRLSFAVFKGTIPEGQHVLHTCDTPLCVNPDHLYLGTQRENSRDAFERGRVQRTPRGTFAEPS